MAPKPKRSPAQAEAGKDFSAGGRRAQAKARKAAHGKLTILQHQRASAAARKAAHTRMVNRLRKAGKLPPAPRQKRAAVMPGWLGNPALPGGWVSGCNDEYPTCAAVAVANHLLAETGLTMPEDEILALHKLAGGDEKGAGIQGVLDVLAWSAEDFCGGKFRLRHWTLTDENVIVTGLVVGIDLPHGSHAVLSHPDGMVSWGRVIPWQGTAEEAWAIEWAR